MWLDQGAQVSGRLDLGARRRLREQNSPTQAPRSHPAIHLEAPSQLSWKVCQVLDSYRRVGWRSSPCRSVTESQSQTAIAMGSRAGSHGYLMGVSRVWLPTREL